MSNDPKVIEWKLLKEQFEAGAGKDKDSNSIEKLSDAEFHRRCLEESMTGSDPVSVTQPPKNKHDEKKKG